MQRFVTAETFMPPAQPRATDHGSVDKQGINKEEVVGICRLYQAGYVVAFYYYRVYTRVIVPVKKIAG